MRTLRVSAGPGPWCSGVAWMDFNCVGVISQGRALPGRCCVSGKLLWWCREVTTLFSPRCVPADTGGAVFH